jgi:hypothetical protein
MTRPFDQLRCVDIRMRISLVRVDADARPDVGIGGGGSDDGVPFAFARGDVEHRPHPRYPCARDDAGLVLDQALIVQVAMAVGEHGA